MHYCHEKLASISVFLNQNNTDDSHDDSCCVVEIEKDDCCTQTTLEVSKKVDNLVIDTQNYPHFAVLNASSESENSVYFQTYQTIAFTSFYCEANAPPYYKLYCQYLFYA